MEVSLFRNLPASDVLGKDIRLFVKEKHQKIWKARDVVVDIAEYTTLHTTHAYSKLYTIVS